LLLLSLLLLLQVANAPVHWSSGVSRPLQLALVEVVLGALGDALQQSGTASGAAAAAANTAALVEAARKLVPKLALGE
jgi:hypothetical protein